MAVTSKDEIKTLTTHYIDGAFVESHGREVIDAIKPTNGKVIARVTLARRGGSAARHRRRQARVRDLRPLDKGRTRGAFAPTACRRRGARR